MLNRSSFVILIYIYILIMFIFFFRTIENRLQFSIHKFALKYNLGTPVAGNFYFAQYDDYVPILFEQLGLNISDFNN